MRPTLLARRGCVLGCALLLSAVALPAAATVLTGPIVNPSTGNTYYLLDTTTWTASEAEAQSLGGHLVTINDQAENDWVYSTFGYFVPDYGYPTLWIGMNDAAHEGTWVWASGAPVTYTHWTPGQPDNARGAEDYGHILTPRDLPQAPQYWGMWNDAADDGYNVGEAYGVVEVVPEPGTTWLLGLGAALVGIGVRGRKTRQGVAS